MDRGELWMVVVVVPAHKAKVQLIKVTTTKISSRASSSRGSDRGSGRKLPDQAEAMRTLHCV